MVFKANMFRLIGVPAIFFLMVVTGTPAAYAEEVITIIPCSSIHNNPKFFDTPSYYIQKGQQIRWYNADDINHRIVIATSGAKAVLSDSGIIKSNGSIPFKFNNIGIYHFSSPVYSWMQGIVSVTDDISSVTMTTPKNNVEVQLTWTPAIPKVGDLTHFKIIFIDRTRDKNQQHMDYVFSIDNPENKILYQQTLHSSWGVEYASYKFSAPGIIIPKITIDAILFQPVEPVEYDFKQGIKVVETPT
jgi:plastocyanin